MINLLGHFFEMSKPDAERAMEIYRTFTRQTDYVVQYLSVARQYEHHTRVEVPKLKHAPVNLGRQLEEYLKDPDFEVHRSQYIAETQAKKNGGGSSSGASKSAAKASNSFPEASTKGSASATTKAAEPSKGADQDLIDFFDSIEQNQTTMAVNPQQHAAQMDPANQWPSNGPMMGQPTGQMPGVNGFAPQQTGFANNSPFQQQNMNAYNMPQQQAPQQMPQQMQPNFTGAPFGGFSQQQPFNSGLGSIPQDSVASFQTGNFQSNSLSPPMETGLQPGQQITNPFRASMLMANPTGMPNNGSMPFPSTTSPPPAAQLNRQSTNPFARPATSSNNSPFAQSTGPQQSAPAPLQPMQTGTNPFARNFSPPAQAQDQRPQTSGALMPQPTGSTNPFRHGAFTNHQTGTGWQHGQQVMGGGLDQLQTTPVFPRPTTSTPWQG